MCLLVFFDSFDLFLLFLFFFCFFFFFLNKRRYSDILSSRKHTVKLISHITAKEKKRMKSFMPCHEACLNNCRMLTCISKFWQEVRQEMHY